MPIYEYQCAECSKSLEMLRKISDPPLLECPACGKPALRKKVSAAAFRLKGGGWYETDFKTSGQKNLASGSSDSAPAKDSAPASDGAKAADKPTAKDKPKSAGDSGSKNTA